MISYSSLGNVFLLFTVFLTFVINQAILRAALNTVVYLSIIILAITKSCDKTANRASNKGNLVFIPNANRRAVSFLRN